MTDSSDNDRVDDMLIRGARDYNLPRPVPREEMWSKIAEARRQNAVVPIREVPATTRARRWGLPGIGIAAALLLSTGIVIGRYVNRSGGSAAGNDSTLAQIQQETRATERRARELAQASPATAADGANGIEHDARGRVAPTGNGADAGRGSSLAYQLVVMRHLAGTEAMITSFRTTARRGERDTTMAQWSRELLSTTRTLEASRAGSDPIMKRLLDDLDLVISQIVQYSTKGTNDPDELDLIEQSINRRGVITKLRSTLPARPISAGT